MKRSTGLPHLLLLALLSPSGLAQGADVLADAAQDEGAQDASAAEGTTAEAEDPIDEWAELDQEIQGLAALGFDYVPVAELWGYLRSTVYYQDQPEHSAGLNLDNLRLNLVGEVAGYGYRLTSELASGRLELLDAWLTTNLGEELDFTIGQFRVPFLRSGLIEASDLLFIARTRNGIFYSQRDQGVMLNGDHGRFHWRLAAHNGADSTFDRQLTTIHTEVNLIGEPPMAHEGAYGAGDTTRLTLGAGVSNDDTTSHGTAVAIEAYFVDDRFSLQAEWLDYSSDYSLVDMEQRGDTSPWSVTTSYMLVPHKYEVALRYDDFDDVSSPMDFDRRTFTAGLNRYVEGHELKWQLNVAAAHKGGAADGLHDLLIGLGLTASF